MALITPSIDVDIRPLLPEHRQAAINLVVTSFFLQEPLNAMLEFVIPLEPLAWIEHIVDQSLRDQCSFVAIDTNTSHSDLVGVILNGKLERDQADDPFVIQSDKLRFIYSLIDNVSAGHDLFQRYRTDRLLRCDIVNVDERQRGQNLSGRLIAASLDKARQLDIQGAFVVCSSLFSKRAFVRHGFDVINEILYAEHGDGRLKDMGVHDRMSLLGKQL